MTRAAPFEGIGNPGQGHNFGAQAAVVQLQQHVSRHQQVTQQPDLCPERGVHDADVGVRIEMTALPRGVSIGAIA